MTASSPDAAPFRVAATTGPKSLAGAIAYRLSTTERVDIDAVGAQACHIAVRAVAIARGLTVPRGYDLVIVPALVLMQEAPRDGTESDTTHGLVLSVRKVAQ